jgi:signal transduction histidine kinase/ligand-binding sensor domain-containing protein
MVAKAACSVRLWIAFAILFVVMMQPSASPANAPDLSQPYSKWLRTVVGSQQGAPAYIQAIAQTRDGFIWLGALDGLYRFDGHAFERIPMSVSTSRLSDAIRSLAAMPNGDLWVGHDYGGISLVRAGAHEAVNQIMLPTVAYLASNRAGDAYAVSGNNRALTISRLVRGRWIPWIQRPWSLPTGLVVDGQGIAWALLGDRLFIVSPNAHLIAQVSDEAFAEAGLAVDGNGQAWIVLKDRVRRLIPAIGTEQPGVLGPVIRKSPARIGGAVAFDGTDFWTVEDDDEIRRYAFDPRSGTDKPIDIWRNPYRSASPDETTHDVPLLVDREHNLWMSSGVGLEKFTRAPFAQIMLNSQAGGFGDSGPYAIADGKGDVWLRKGRSLFRAEADGTLRQEQVVLPAHDTPCASPGGGVWIPDGKGALALLGGVSGRSISLAGTKGYLSQPWFHCAEDGAGRLWVAEQFGVLQLGKDHPRPVDLGEDSGFMVHNLIADDDGSILAYVGRGSLWRVDGPKGGVVVSGSDLPIGFIEVMYRSERYLYLGGDHGLARYDGGSIRFLSRDRFPYLAVTTGFAQTRSGETWLQSAKGVVRLKSVDLDRAFDQPGFEPKAQIFGISDGLPGPVTSLNMSTLVADRFGRIWVTTNAGIARFDPKGETFNDQPPPVVITAIEAGDRRYRSADSYTLPGGTNRLRIDFAALSFADPDKVEFKYRLVGIDPTWVEGGQDRAATYTSLPPGTYQFQVIAANNSGVWNLTGAWTQIVVKALFYQTWWFRILILLLLGLLIWLAYRWRVAGVSRQFRRQAAERANERERIARDIHDTLLQSIQGIVLRFQSVASRMDASDPNRSLMEKTLDRADDLIAEGKERVHGLRANDDPGDLPTVLELLIDDAPFHVDMVKLLNVRGEVRLVKADAVMEIREIVSEALFNAARHARAGQVVVDVTYGARALDIAVTDDGVGIGFPVRKASTGTGKGFGIVGMHGRATSIGGTLSIGPADQRGTTLFLRVPARRAYDAVVPFWHRFRPGR